MRRWLFLLAPFLGSAQLGYTQHACTYGCWQGTALVDGKTVKLAGSAEFSDAAEEDGRPHYTILLDRKWITDVSDGIEPQLVIQRHDNRVMPGAGAHAVANACDTTVSPAQMDVHFELYPEDAPGHRSVIGITRSGAVTFTTVTKQRVTGNAKFDGCADVYDGEGNLIKQKVAISADVTFDARRIIR